MPRFAPNRTILALRLSVAYLFPLNGNTLTDRPRIGPEVVSWH